MNCITLRDVIEGMILRDIVYQTVGRETIIIARQAGGNLPSVHYVANGSMASLKALNEEALTALIADLQMLQENK